MLKLTLAILIWILVIQIMSLLTGMLTQSQISGWYSELIKPALTPPSFVFPLVWTILYIMIALAGWHLWSKRSEPRAKKAFYFFILQLLLNWLWTPIFFYGHWTGLAFLWLLALIMVTLYVIYLCHARYRLSAYLLVPYLLWLGFAAYLNAAIWYLN